MNILFKKKFDDDTEYNTAKVGGGILFRLP